MPGRFTRLKTWTALENLLYTDLNAEFDNIILNMVPSTIDDYSSTVSAMRVQTNPGSQGSESLATSLAGELERLRFVISRIIGKTYWYDTPSRSLEIGTAEIVRYLPFDGESGSKVLGDSVRRGAIINLKPVAPPVSGGAFSEGSRKYGGGQSVNTGDFDSTSGNVKFGKFSYALGTDNYLGLRGQNTLVSQGSLAMHFRSITSGDALAFNPQLGISVKVNGSGKLQVDLNQSTATASETAKDSVSITGTDTVAGISTFKHMMLKWKVNGMTGTGTDALGLTLDAASEGTQLSNQTLSVNVGDGGNWLIGVLKNDPAWTKFSSFKVAPASEASSPWTAAGAAGAESVSNGILTITTDVTNKGRSYSLAPAIDFNNFTCEFKMRNSSGESSTGNLHSFGSVLDPTPISFRIKDGALSRSMALYFNDLGIWIVDGYSAATTGEYLFLNTRDWHVYRLTTQVNAGNVYVNIYIDGELRKRVYLGIADAGVDSIDFGDLDNATAGHYAQSQWEYVAYHLSSTSPPYLSGSTGNIDDVVLLDEFLSDSNLETSLTTTKARTVLQKDRKIGIVTPPSYGPFNKVAFETAGAGAPSEILQNFDYFNPTFMSDGVTPIRVCVEGFVRNNIVNSTVNIGIAFSQGPNSSTTTEQISGLGTTDQIRLGYPHKSYAIVIVNQEESVMMEHCGVFPAGLVTVSIWTSCDNASTNTIDLRAFRCHVNYLTT